MTAARSPGLAPLRAADYQPPDDQARAIAEAADAGMASDIDGGFDRLRDGIDVAALAALLASLQYGRLMTALGLDQLEAVMLPAANRLAAVYDASAEGGMEDVAGAAPPVFANYTTPGFANYHAPQVAPSALQEPIFTPAGTPGLAPVAPATPARPSAPALPVPAPYDPLAAEAVADKQAARDALLAELRQSAERTIAAVIQDGVAAQQPPAETARDLRDTLGLVDREAKAIANFRRLLELGDRTALDRVLRDRRFDASIERAIRGEALAPEKIDRMVARYADRYRRHRARRLARTETLRAANAGRRAAWVQYADRAGLTPDEVRRFWRVAADERVCVICRSIPLMNPSGVALDGAYSTPEGEADMPPLHPSCRCTERYGVMRAGMQSAL